MVGLIQKVLLDLVEQRAGKSAVESVRKLAGLPEERFFRIGEVYPDDEAQRLLKAAAEVLGMNEEQFGRAYADQFFGDALVRFKKFFELAPNSRKFLEMQTTIHNTFASGVADPRARQAVKDKFNIETIDDRNIITHYRSPNRLCKLYMALGTWIANHYGDSVEFKETRCLHRGDDECEIHVHWTQLASEAQA